MKTGGGNRIPSSIRLLSLIVAVLVSVVGCVSDTPKAPDKVWTVPEVANWYVTYRRIDPNAWDGILYRGTDSKYHHYIARLTVAQEWVYIIVNRDDLKVPETRRYSTSTNAPIGYYF